MKKTFALLLVAILAFGIVGCASADTVGLGSVTSIGSVKDAQVIDGDNYDGQAQVNNTVCTVRIGDDGKVVSVKFDVTQTMIKFSVEGKLITDTTAEILTKMEKGEAYGMRKASSIGAEWFEQIAAFENWCVGKTIDEILAIKTYDKGDGSHTAVPDVEELKTTCTITVGDYLAALKKAAEAAK